MISSTRSKILYIIFELFLVWPIYIITMPAVLLIRYFKGKEDWNSIRQRLAIGRDNRNNIERKFPLRKLIWVHAVSVGELNAALIIIRALQSEFRSRKILDDFHFLITTQTVSAANVLAKNQLTHCTHQFFFHPLTLFIKLFLRRWRPDYAIFMESEIWPSLIFALRAQNIKGFLLNARFSQASLKFWSCMKKYFAINNFDYFEKILCAGKEDCQSLQKFNANAIYTGNVKLSAPALAFKEDEAVSLKKVFKSHHTETLVFASFSADEFKLLAKICSELVMTYNIIIIPRHINKSHLLLKELAENNLKVSIRSHQQLPQKNKIYLADTYNELGLFYEIADIAIVGGSFGQRGGQNMLEPLKFGKPVFVGPNTKNFQEIMSLLLDKDLVIQTKNQANLLNYIQKIQEKEGKSKLKQWQDRIKDFNREDNSILQNYVKYLLSSLLDDKDR